MTEAAHQIASNPLPPQPRKFGSVGKATGTVQISIRNDAGSELPMNENGEICIRGGNVMDGYENNPAANYASYCEGSAADRRPWLPGRGWIFIHPGAILKNLSTVEVKNLAVGNRRDIAAPSGRQPGSSILRCLIPTWGKT